MQRTKILAAALALVTASAAASLLLGSATASTWHAYEGDVYAGHAYGLQVPAAAESYEVVFAGDAGAARLAVFDPAGLKVGTYELSPAMATAAFLDPAEGRHVLYVYELTGGALQVRVNSEEAPPLSLQKIPLAREDVEIAEGAGDALSKGMTVTLRQAPVFLTLLYEGSVENLDATISSEKGPAVTIADETGTAFSPGVWSSLTGQRTSDAANLDGAVYEIVLSADEFEGSMTLASLSLDLSVPYEVVPEAPVVTTPSPLMPLSASAATFTAAEGDAIEFTAAAGKLVLTPAAYAAPDHAHRNDTPEEHEHEAPHSRYARIAVSIYAPDDTLLAHVDEVARDFSFEVDLPVEGAYVLYVHDAPHEGVTATLEEGATFQALRPLPIAEEAFEFYAITSQETVLELQRAPVHLTMEYTDDSLGVLSYASLENPNGVVADLSALAYTPFLRVDDGWGQTYPEHFAAGEHVFHASSFTPVGVRIVSLAYVRDAPLPVEPVVEEPVAEPAPEPAEEPASEEPAEEPAPEEESGFWGPLSDLFPW